MIDKEKTRAYQREYQKAYTKTETGKEARRQALHRYLKTEKGKATLSRYRRTEKFKVVRKRYQQSEKGKLFTKFYNIRARFKKCHKEGKEPTEKMKLKLAEAVSEIEAFKGFNKKGKTCLNYKEAD